MVYPHDGKRMRKFFLYSYKKIDFQAILNEEKQGKEQCTQNTTSVKREKDSWKTNKTSYDRAWWRVMYHVPRTGDEKVERLMTGAKILRVSF